MPDLNHRAKRRLSELGSEAASNFDAVLLHNCVYESVGGAHDRNNDLIQALNLAESAYALSETAESDALDSAAFDAGETLNDVVEELYHDQIARACGEVVQDADEWTDAWDGADIRDAKREAREWLQTHLDAAERTGALEEVAADA